MEKYGVYFCDYARDDEPEFIGTYEECETYIIENHLDSVCEDTYGEQYYDIFKI